MAFSRSLRSRPRTAEPARAFARLNWSAQARAARGRARHAGAGAGRARRQGLHPAKRAGGTVVLRSAPRAGRARVRQELQAKGIAADAVADAVSSLRTTEVERARALWQHHEAACRREGAHAWESPFPDGARRLSRAPVAKILRAGRRRRGLNVRSGRARPAPGPCRRRR